MKIDAGIRVSSALFLLLHPIFLCLVYARYVSRDIINTRTDLVATKPSRALISRIKERNGRLLVTPRGLRKRDPPDARPPVPEPVAEEHAGPSKAWDFVRDWDNIAWSGFEIRGGVLDPPAKDLSKEGSELILDPFNYKYDIEDSVYNRLWLGTRQMINAALGETLGGELKTRDTRIFNVPASGSDEEMEEIYRFDTIVSKGVIIIHEWYKNKDIAEVKEQKVSEIVWRVWHRDVEHAAELFSAEKPSKKKIRKNPSAPKLQDLKYIIIEGNTNEETEYVIEEVFRRQVNTVLATNAFKKAWEPSINGYNQVTEGFQCKLNTVASIEDEDTQKTINAIVGSRGGKPPARLLVDHSHALGGKEIVEITIDQYIDNIGAMKNIMYKLGHFPLKSKS
ncbi:hypothetical protein ABW20_dc0104123 [Dactylellina cionopaga]|nr:hypothetical protein ABW20_dc0104123 [Dactylellina cionopaga]